MISYRNLKIALFEAAGRGVPFSAKNFPKSAGSNNKQESFPGLGERTTYVPTDRSSNFKYENGFPLIRDTPLVSLNGEEILKVLPAGTFVHFTYPTQLFRLYQVVNQEKLSGSRIHDMSLKDAIVAPISLVSHLSSSIGYVAINRVGKPTGKLASRVSKGKSSQEVVASEVERISLENNIPFKLLGIAKPGSTVPDVSFTHSDTSSSTTTVEVKGTDNLVNEITVFDKSTSRSESQSARALLAQNHIQRAIKIIALEHNIKYMHSIADVFDYARDVLDIKDSGFAGDANAPKSGKLPVELAITSSANLKKARQIILDHFSETKDTYFALHDRKNNKVKLYYTGYGQNRLNVPDFPQLNRFRLATYGGVSRGMTRIGFKIKLKL